MRKIYFIFFLLLAQLSGYSQVVTTIPAFPTADQEVTIIFDVSKAQDTRARGLLGKTDDVFLWSGAGSTETGNAFEFQPTGQTDFAKPFEPGKMTSLGNNRWQIKLVPRQYFNVPANRPIRRLGLLLKSGNGQAQTEDVFIRIYENRLSVARLSPTEKNFFVDPSQDLLVRATASQRANLTLLLDNTTVATAANQDSVRFTLNTGTQPGQRRTVIFRAQTATETAADTFYFTVRPQSPVAALPAGLRDGITYQGANRATLVLFAPQKSFVYVIGEFNNWSPAPQYLMNRTPDGNRYWLELNNLPAGQEVAYQYLVDGTLAVADPYAEKILDPNNDRFITATTYPNLKAYPTGASGIVSVLKTNQTPYTWKVNNFQRPDPKNMVVYELLVRDFVGTRNYKTVADSIPYLKRLGINAIELMPIMEFSGNDSWGYNPIFYFAPDKAYGTKNDLKAFIDKCHENGIAVILDMVLNQADYEFPYVRLYWDGTKPAANNPFFNQQATHPFSVFFDFNHESPATQAYVERVNRFWLEEYKFDGYRFDLSKGFTQKNTGSDVGAWSAYDASRVTIWKRIYNQIRSVDPTAYVMLEHFADNTEEKELADYGMLFWGNLNDPYRTLAKGFNANPNWISYKQRGWQSPYVVGYMESHDEERLVYDVRQNGGASGNYNTRTLPTALDRAKLAAAFFLPIPGPKLIWQFGELGYDVSINENGRTGAKPIRWEYLQDPERRKLFRVYQELIKLKLTQPAFQTSDFTLNVDQPVKRITLNHPSMTVFLIGNFDVQLQATQANFPRTGKWYDYFTGQEVEVTNTQTALSLQPGEFHLYTTEKLATPEAGLVPYSGSSTGTVTGLEPVLDDILLFPNPTADAAMVELENSYFGPVELQLGLPSGQMVRSQTVQKTTTRLRQPISLQQLPTGLYWLKIRQGDRQTVRKIMKW
ncbi:hypothetical protein GCM10023189_37170 [Nibrella saemangeumensis]|uniref:Glycosyl hydrolase family 13 catalytic domain-containing protein n=1 Tax=Nibrella saemangeumensis TaxID=1084526 RepID=A0ABP8N9K9_9BACT